MPKFLDEPQWYNSDGELVPGGTIYLHLFHYYKYSGDGDGDVTANLYFLIPSKRPNSYEDDSVIDNILSKGGRLPALGSVSSGGTLGDLGGGTVSYVAGTGASRVIQFTDGTSFNNMSYYPDFQEDTVFSIT